MENKKDTSKLGLHLECMMPQEEKLETGKKGKELLIGIPKETHKNENRIPLTPQGVELLKKNGHRILIESGAGGGANYSDRDFSEKGAEIKNKKEVFQADIILKVSPFTNNEIDLLKGRQTVFSSLQIATRDEDYFRSLMDKKITAVAFELLQDLEGCYPITRSMSEIEGNTSIFIAAEYLSNMNGGKGVMLGGVTGITPTEVVILGAGTAGEHAARTALGLGAIVKIFDASISKLKKLQAQVGQNVYTSVMQPQVLKKALKTSDVVIGTLPRFTNENFFIVDEDMVMKMKSGSVIIDLSIGQGSCFETSEITTPDKPIFVKHGVTHYCVPNLPSRVARTASIALSNVFIPLLVNKGRCGGIHQLIKDDKGIRQGVYIYNGIFTNSLIGDYFGIASKDIDLLLAAF